MKGAWVDRRACALVGSRAVERRMNMAFIRMGREQHRLATSSRGRWKPSRNKKMGVFGGL